VAKFPFEERVSILFCSYMDGTDKQPLFIIGKSEKPRCLKNKLTLPTEYKANRKAWMKSILFVE
jgi:hypothetical protein